MSTAWRVVPDTYKDSVALMVISARLMKLDGIVAASVVMATPANLDNLATAGLERPVDAQPSDVVVSVAGDDDACAAALELAVELLTADAATVGATSATQVVRPSSIQGAVAADPGANLALISVPGAYAAAEALKALRLGLHVMLFSDNVPVDQELALKTTAASLGLLVMGPDCGTAIVNGTPLGFANAVRRGTIGVVGASGTGMQEVTSRIHNLGGGVSQAFGTGGHDLADAIGGISMRQAMRALDADPATEVIVLVSKPPGPATTAAVLADARSMTTPVVAVFLGADLAGTEPPGAGGGSIVAARTLAEAADQAVAIAQGASPTGAAAAGEQLRSDVRGRLDRAAASLAPAQRFIRGVFCGGTFCYEAQLVARAAGCRGASNTPSTAGNPGS
jgi:FdrA protein